MKGTPVIQPWVCGLTLMQQSVILAAVRGPDGVPKEHPVKAIMRWYRRSVLISAFDGKALNDPYAPGGGSFTGPLLNARVEELIPQYFKHVDELPHHFQLHLMHAAEIVGYKHPNKDVSSFWLNFYLSVVRDAHLRPETEEKLDYRLGDSETQWRRS